MFRIWISTLLLLFCAISLLAQAPTVAPPKPSVAIFSNMDAPRPIEEYLRSKGWQTLFIQWGQPFDRKSLRRFNVIIVPEYPNIDPNVRYNSNLGVKVEYEEQVRKLLWDFVDQGGGLLMYGGHWPINRTPANVFLAHWDAALLNEQVLDPAHRYQQATGIQWVYQYTDQFAKHPITKDVTRIFYPTRDLYGAGINPLKLGAGWQWLIKGSTDSVSRPLVMNQQNELPDETKAGTYASAPPLAAVRTAGKGRVAVYGWSPIATFFDYTHYMVEDIYFTRGGDGKSSDGLRLLEQTLAYLAEPSQAIAMDTLAAVKGDEAAVKGLPGLAWWLKADAGVRANDVGQVSAWDDQSGKGLIAAQGNDAQQPLLVKDGLNGKPAIRFDGKGKTLATPPVVLAPDHTVVVVARMPGIAGGSSGTPFSYADLQTQVADAELCVFSNQGKYSFRVRYPGLDTYNLHETLFEPPFKVTDPLLLVQQHATGKTVSAFRNGMWLMDRPVKEAFATTNKGFRLGMHSNTGQYLNGDIAEVLVFNTALSAEQRQIVEGYLAKKYGIALIPEYGGYANQPVRERPKLPDQIHWTKAQIGDPDPNMRMYRGVIGARTKLTGGTGTVAEYAAAARAAKLDFIGFLEDVEDLSAISKETWDQFREECRQACGPDLLVLPGQIVRRGPAGDRYFRVSDFASPPPKSYLTADGKRIDNALYEHFNAGLNTHGPFDLRNQPSPTWVSRAYNSMGLVTTIGGKTVVNLEPFLYQMGVQDDPKPIAIDIITSPAQVAEAAKRFLNYRFCYNLDDLRLTLKDPDMGKRAMISNGPLITQWQGANQWRQTYGVHVPGTERVQMRLQAQSDQPLTEAIIYDGTKVFRRYQLEGKTCDLLINLLHDRQHQFTAVVRDAAGRLAVCAQMEAQDLFNRRFMCSDRQNSLSNAFELDNQGYFTWSIGGFMQNKFNMLSSGYPANPQTINRVPPYWDGCPGGFVQGGVDSLMWTPPLVTPQPPNTATFPVYRMEFPLGSRDVLCQAMALECVMPDKPFHYSGFWPMRPREDYTAYTRFVEFKKTPNGPTAMLVEGAYTMLKDGKWEPREWYWHAMSHILYTFSGQPNARSNWAFVDPGTGDYQSGSTPPKTAPASFVKPLHPGGYVAYTTLNEAGAFFPLDAPVTIAQELHDGNWFRTWVGLNHLGQTYKKGDIVPYRFVVFSGSINTPPDTREVEKFRKELGLSGDKPAYTVTPRSGKVRSTKYVLEIDAQDGGFGGTISQANLGMRLPVRVHGVNPNWTCGIVEKAEKWWLPAGVLDDLKLTPAQQAAPTVYSAYIALDTSKDHDVWIGNVVLCDQPELRLTLLPNGEGGFGIEAHNPTEREITATVRLAAEFSLAPAFSQQVTVKAGSSVMLEVGAAK